MFSKLDTSNDLYLDHSELAAINLEKYEVCIRPFFNSCDSYRDSKVSMAEWCLCFWRESKLIQDLFYLMEEKYLFHFDIFYILMLLSYKKTVLVIDTFKLCHI